MKITKILSCFVVGILLMTVVTISIFASEPIPTKIHLQDATFKWHTNQSLIAELVDENNQSLSGKEVVFYANTSVGWHEIGNSTTNESGIAKYDFFVTMPDGTYLFKADFKGDEVYVSSSDTAEITVIDNIVFTVTAAFIVKAIVVPAAVHIVKECVWKPYFSPVAADYCKENDIRVPIGDDILQKKETWDTAADIANIAYDVKSAYKHGAAALYHHGAKAAASGRAIGGHARWLYYHGQHAVVTAGGAGLGEMLGHAVVEYGLTDDQKDSIHSGTSPSMDSASQTATHIFNSKMPQKVSGCNVDPTIGYGEQIKVPEDTARMRIYLGWEFDVCPSTLDFYTLKDPYSNTVTPSFVYLNTTNGTAVELTAFNPIAGEWNLWLDGSVLPNWTVGIMYAFDGYVEVLSEHQAVNPGETIVYKTMVTNFKDTDATIDLSLSDVPIGWNVYLSKTQTTLAPNTSDIIDLTVTPPITVRYGTNKTITVTAEFEEDSTSYSANCTTHISPVEEIEDGIAWLNESQKLDGSWSNNVGITSLATLAYLNAGYDETEEDVREGIDYILGHVHSDGTIYGDSNHKAYETSLATITLIATHNDSYDSKVEKAKNWLKDLQWDDDCLLGTVNEDNWYYGGFTYPRSTTLRPDLSNTQFALMALDAAGLPKDDSLWTKAQVFLNRTQVRDESNDQSWANGRDSGGFIYVPDGTTAGGGSIDGYGSMTGAGIWSLRLCGVDPKNDGRLNDALNWVKNNYFWDRNPGMSDPESGKYYYYLSMSKALTMAVGVGGKIDSHYWYDDMARNLISLQEPEEGYWINSNSWAWENVPELATSYALLSLETRIFPPEISRLSYLTFILHSNADLHVYDPLGRHVGMNYTTGHIEMQIPGAVYQSYPQNITLPGLDAGNYKVRMVGTSNGEYTLDVIAGFKDKILEHETYTNTITTGVAHDATVNAAMLTGLSFHIEEPEICVPCRITQLTSDASMQDRPSMIYANSNHYVAYQSWETGESYKGDIFVKKFDSNWNEIRKIQITNDMSHQDSPSLAFANNKYNVVYLSNETGNWDIFVKQYDSNWNYITKVQLTTLSSSHDLPSVIYADNNFYVAYQSWENGYSYHGDIFVKKFDSNWNYISKTQVTSRTSYQDRPSLLFANDRYYVAYMSEETGDLDIFVKEYDSNWNYLQKRQITSESSSQSFPSLVFADNIYALAYASNEYGNLDIFVKQYDSSWNLIKKIQSTDETSHQRRPSLIFADSDFYVSYVSDETGDWDIFSKTADCTEICGNGIDDNSDGFVDENCNHAPNVLITTPSGTQSGNILISYTLTDPESGTCTLSSVQYSQDNLIWHGATMGGGGDGTNGLTSSPTGVAHTYAWASATDLPDIDDSTVYFRIKANDGAIDGVYGVSDAFHIDNVVTYDPYDTNENCVIEMGEMGQALDDWYDDIITMGEMGAVLDLWYMESYC